MVEVIVEYDYDALHDDELTIKVGEVIVNVRKLDEDGWLEGELNGRKGMFPDNFVKEIKKDTEPKEEGHPVSRERSGNVASLVQRMSVYGLPAGGFQPHPHPKSIRRKSKKRQCKVLYEYIPHNEDELELKVGEILDINEEVEEGWWSGTLNGKSGLFPSNFVKEIEGTEDEETQEALDDADSNSKESPFQGPVSPFSPIASPGNGNGAAAGSVAQPKKVRGVGFGDIFKEGSVKLKVRLPSTECEKQEKPLPTMPPVAKPNLEATKSEPENKSKPNEYCKAVFPYEGSNDDELSLKEGDVILVLSKDTGEPGWWKGELNGKQGVFPDNFVVITETEKDAVPAPKAPTKLPLKPDIDDKPKKPPPPTKSPAPKPEFPTGEKKPLPSKPEEKDEKLISDHKPGRPAAPMVPPKKPIPPMKTNNLLRHGAAPPKRPDKPLLPPPSAKPNGELPIIRPKSEFDMVMRPIQETEQTHPRPKSLDLDSQMDRNNSECDLISFDDIVATSERLDHPTASRPKMPGRRLPAQYTGIHSPTKEVHVDKILKHNKEEDEVAKPKPSEVKKPTVEVHVDKTVKQNKEDDELARPRPSSLKKPSVPTTAISTDFLKQNSLVPSIADLKNKTEADDVNKCTVEELRAQITDLTALVESLKAEHRKELADLRKDLEEEKRKRSSLEKEIDKLKKTVLST